MSTPETFTIDSTGMFNCEFWQYTNQLRWMKMKNGKHMLQQMSYCTTTGEQKWDFLPVVNEGDESA